MVEIEIPSLASESRGWFILAENMNKYFQTVCLKFLLVVVLAIVTMVAQSSDTVRVLRDNAIEIKGEKLVLYGIAVPNATAKCLEGEAQWPCGATATLRLYNLLKDSPLSCERLENSSKAPLARCRNSQFDIAEQLVLEGWALAVGDNEDFVDGERQAKLGKVGIWRDNYSPPLEWRQYPQSQFNPILDLLCSSCAVRKQ